MLTAHASREHTQDSRERRAHRAHIARLAAAGLIAAALILFAVENRQGVVIDYISGQRVMPLYQVIVATFVAGVLAGLMLAHRHRKGH